MKGRHFLIAGVWVFGFWLRLPAGEIEPTLGMILSAIQERYTAVSQRMAVEQAWGEKESGYGTDPQSITDFFSTVSAVTERAPIDWGSGIPSNPSDDYFASWTLAQRMEVLKLAYEKLYELKTDYLNLDPALLENEDMRIPKQAFRASQDGLLDERTGWSYTHDDFPSKPEVLEHSDYPALLYELADTVSRLRCLAWPVITYRVSPGDPHWWHLTPFDHQIHDVPYDFEDFYQLYGASFKLPQYTGLLKVEDLKVTETENLSSLTFTYQNPVHTAGSLTTVASYVSALNVDGFLGVERNYSRYSGKMASWDSGKGIECNTSLIKLDPIEMMATEHQGTKHYYVNCSVSVDGGLRYFNDGRGFITDSVPGTLHMLEHFRQLTRMKYEKTGHQVILNRDYDFLGKEAFAPSGDDIVNAQVVMHHNYYRDPLVYGTEPGTLTLKFSTTPLVPDWAAFTQDQTTAHDFLYSLEGVDYTEPPNDDPAVRTHYLYRGQVADHYLPDASSVYLQADYLDAGFTEPELTDWNDIDYVAGVDTYAIFVPDFEKFNDPLYGAKTGRLQLGGDGPGMRPASPYYYYYIELGSGRHTRHHNARLVLVIKEDGTFGMQFLGDRAEYGSTGTTATHQIYLGEALKTTVTSTATGGIQVQQHLATEISNVADLSVSTLLRSFDIEPVSVPEDPDETYLKVVRTNHRDAEETFLLGNRTVKTDLHQGEYETVWSLGRPTGFASWVADYHWSHRKEQEGTMQENARESIRVVYNDRDPATIQALEQTGLDAGDTGYVIVLGSGVQVTDRYGSAGSTYSHAPEHFTWTTGTDSHTTEEQVSASGWTFDYASKDFATPLYSTTRTETPGGYTDVLTLGPGESYTTTVDRWVPDGSLPAGQVPWGLKQVTYPDGTVLTLSDVYDATSRTVTRFQGLLTGEGIETVLTYNLLGDLLSRTTTLTLNQDLVLETDTAAYDAFGLTQVQDRYNRQQSLTRNDEGHLTAISGHGKDVLYRDHDRLGRPETVEYPEQNLTTTVTNELNRVVVTDGTWIRETLFDSAGNVESRQHTGSYQQQQDLSVQPDGSLLLVETNKVTHRVSRTQVNPSSLDTSADLSGAQGTRETISWGTLNGIPCRITTLKEREVDAEGHDTFSQTVAITYTDGLGRIQRQQTLDPSSETVAYLTTDYHYNGKGQLERIEFPTGPDLLFEYHPLGYLQFQTEDLNGNGQRDIAVDQVQETELTIESGELITRTYTYVGGIRKQIDETRVDPQARKLTQQTGTQEADEWIVANPQPDHTTVTFNGKPLFAASPLTASWTDPDTADLSEPVTGSAIWSSEGPLFSLSQQQGIRNTTTTFDGNGDPIQTDDGETLHTFEHQYDEQDLSSRHQVKHDGVDGTEITQQPLLNTSVTAGKGGMPSSVSTSRTPQGGLKVDLKRANGQTNTVTYNPAGQPIRKDYSNGDWETQSWTSSGQIAATANSRSETQSWQYDPIHDRLVEWQVDGAQRLRIEPGDRNQLGLPLRMSDASGTRVLTYEEDKWSGLEQEEWTSGRLSGFALDYTPDSRGRLHTHTVKKGADTLSTSTYTYKGSGERMDTLTVNIPGAPAVTIQYLGDAFQSDGVTYTVNTVQTYRMELKRDQAHRIDELDSSHNLFDADWQRNALGQIQSLNESSGSTSFDYHPDNGSLKEANGPDGHWGYTFNDSGELEQLRLNGLSADVSADPQTGAVTGLSHGQTNGREYLLSGQMHTNATVNIYLNGTTNSVYTVTETNRYAFVIDAATVPALSDPQALVRVPWRVAATRPGQDYEQNLAVTWIEDAALFPPEVETVVLTGGRRTSDAFLSYDWDGTDRITRLTHQATGMSTEHVYDAQDRRVEKRVYDSGNLVRTHRYVYEDWLPVCEEVLDRWGNVDYRNVYVYGAGPNGVRDPSIGVTTQIALIAHLPKYGAPQLSAPVYNYRWDVMGLIDVETGNLVARYRYSPFGKLLSAEGSRADQNPFRFAGAYWDSETETAYFGYRMYDPRTKQWLSRDPIGEAGGMNLVAYCDNDSVNLGPDILGLAATPVRPMRSQRRGYAPNGFNHNVHAARIASQNAHQQLTLAILQGQSVGVQDALIQNAKAVQGLSLGKFIHNRTDRSYIREYRSRERAYKRAAAELKFHIVRSHLNQNIVQSQRDLPESSQTFSRTNRDIIRNGGSPLMLIRMRDPKTHVPIEVQVQASNYFRGTNGHYFPRPGHRGGGFHERDVVQGVNAFGNISSNSQWARSGAFTNSPIIWQAARPRGTGQSYRVFQRNDIDWGFVRTSGDKRFIGKTNAYAARFGLAPQLSDGNFATLHHIGQDARGGLVEASTRYHGVGKYGQDALHSIYGRSQPHPVFNVNRRAFTIDTREYWNWRIGNVE